MTKGAKTPAFISYLTIVHYHIMIRTIFYQLRAVCWIWLDSRSCARVRGWDRGGVGLRRHGHITSEGGVLILHTNRCFWKDLDKKYNKDSNSITAHRKVCDGFKKKECTVSANLSSSHASVQDWSNRPTLGEFKHQSQSHSPSLRMRMVWKLRRIKTTFNSWWTHPSGWRRWCRSRRRKGGKRGHTWHIVDGIYTVITTLKEPFRGDAFF